MTKTSVILAGVKYCCSPVLGTNYLDFDRFVPKTGLRFRKG